MMNIWNNNNTMYVIIIIIRTIFFSSHLKESSFIFSKHYNENGDV